MCDRVHFQYFMLKMNSTANVFLDYTPNTCFFTNVRANASETPPKAIFDLRKSVRGQPWTMFLVLIGLRKMEVFCEQIKAYCDNMDNVQGCKWQTALANPMYH